MVCFQGPSEAAALVIRQEALFLRHERADGREGANRAHLPLRASPALFEPEGRIIGYDIAPDGEHLVVVLDEEEPEPGLIVVIPNFADELKAKMAEAGQ